MTNKDAASRETINIKAAKPVKDLRKGNLLNCVSCVLKACSSANVPWVFTCSRANVPWVLTCQCNFAC